MSQSFTSEEALVIAQKIGLDFDKEKFSLEEFKAGLSVELEHGKKDPETNVTNSVHLLQGRLLGLI